MPILEYFKTDVRRALEEKLADDSMFRSIRGTCLRVMNDAKEIKLHPTELYYLAFCVIDRMKGQSTSQAEFYSKDEAWYEYDEVLRDIYGGDSDHERHSALALIIQTCAEWLLRSRDMSRLGIVSNLKLQIAAIRAEHDPGKKAAALAEMETGIQRYEAQNKTGNPVLDTLLTAKSIFCQQHDINFTCVADGHLLDFMRTGDICAIVGTALDNATESVQRLANTEKRLIRVAIYSQHGFIMLRFENYCEEPVPLDNDGMPPHGYGIRSVRAAAQKYGGMVTVHCQDNWFVLRVLLPRKEADAKK